MKHVLVVSLLSAACAGTPQPPDPAQTREALMQADRDFLARTTAHGVDGWADFFASDGVMFPTTGRVDGRENIRRAMAGAFTPGVVSLEWEPGEAVAGAGGTLGYTIGTFRVLDGDTAITTGNYVTIWKLEDGAWRVAVDIGNVDATPDSAAL